MLHLKPEWIPEETWEAMVKTAHRSQDYALREEVANILAVGLDYLDRHDPRGKCVVICPDNRHTTYGPYSFKDATAICEGIHQKTTPPSRYEAIIRVLLRY